MILRVASYEALEFWMHRLTRVDALLRYRFEQGLSKKRLTREDIFAPELLDT